MYTSTYVMKLFDISRESVRQYASEFAAYLSPQTNPSDRQPKQFTDDDLRVYAQIVSMKGEGKRYADIHAALANGQRTEPPDRPAAQAELTAVTRSATLQAKAERLEAELIAALDANKELTGRIDELRRQLSEAQAEIKSLNREIGRLEAARDNE